MAQDETIISRDNAKLKFARSVRDGKERDFIFIEGTRLTEEAIRSNIEILDAFVSESASEKASSIIGKRCETAKVAAKAFDSITDTENSQGIVMIARRPETLVEEIDLGKGIVVFLNQINNPSNLGAVIRTAEAAGVSALITSADSTDAFSPKAVRASMGSCFRLPIVEGMTFDDAIDCGKQKGLISTAADINARESYTEIDWKKPRLLVFGSEAHGLTHRELDGIEQTIHIPMANLVESLNLAVSVGIILFEANRVRSSAFRRPAL
ncbi:MAG TPA: RNA methyltransferase [Pyrinomonadaceae bacterium]|nr:RNA methyltransferase [Pyrinomonadaceae bacterium]